MGKVIIGIHGRSNKPKKETLTTGWKRAISEGLRKNQEWQEDRLEFDFELAYYSDIHYSEGPLADAQYPYDEAGPGPLRRYKAGLRDRLRAWAGGWLDTPLDWIEVRTRLFSTFARGIQSEHLQDLEDYYTRPGKRESTQARLLELLQPNRSDEILLIAHSMGTIVAYDTLLEMDQKPESERVSVAHFVTIGSPLGLTPVKGEIRRVYDGPFQTPSAVTQSWVNFSDSRDRVCLDAHLRDDYRSNRAEVRVRDRMVHNDYPGNPHKSYGYLRTPELSEHIAAFLQAAAG